MKWLDRTWDFDRQDLSFSAIADGLDKSPEKLRLLIREAKSPTNQRFGDKWSVNEHAGHLLTIESLWIARLDDFVLGRAELRPWNGTNADTEAGAFNLQRLEKIVDDFEEIRKAHLAMIRTLESAAFSMKSHHQRFGREMRLIDHLHMMHEHDLHHLAAIRKIFAQP